MRQVITVETMRESDAHTIADYVPSRELMARAAQGVFQAVPNWTGSVGILTGSGNNGGDGYALACILAQRQIPCRVYRVSEKFSEDGKFFYDRAVRRRNNAFPVVDKRSLACMFRKGYSFRYRISHNMIIKKYEEEICERTVKNE